MAVLVGALAGSYDTAQGTMRYLVMTGVPRRRLYGTRVLGTAIATILCCVPADRRSTIVAAYVLRHDSFNDPTAERRRSARSGPTSSNPLVFGLVSVAVGSLLRSNGAAIGVSLGFSLGGGDPHRPDRRATSARRSRRYLLPAATDIVGAARPQREHLAGRRLRGHRRVAHRLPRRRAVRVLRDEY